MKAGKLRTEKLGIYLTFTRFVAQFALGKYRDFKELLV